MIDIDDLLHRLFNATYTENSSTDWRNYEFKVIGEKRRGIIENTVREWYNEQLSERDAKVAELEAKVFVYEQIISKSNFAPMLLEECPQINTGEQREGE